MGIGVKALVYATNMEGMSGGIGYSGTALALPEKHVDIVGVVFILLYQMIRIELQVATIHQQAPDLILKLFHWDWQR